MIKANFYKLIGPAVFIYILFKIDLGATFSIIHKIDASLLIVALFFVFIHIFGKFLRLVYILKIYDTKITPSRLITNYFYTFGLGLFTPFRSGEFLRMSCINKFTHSWPQSLYILIVDRVFDLFFIFSMAIFALLALTKSMVFVFIFIIWIILLLLGTRLKTLKIIVKFIFPVQYKKYAAKNVFEEAYGKLTKASILVILIITSVSWLFFYINGYYLSQSLALPLSFYQVVLCISIAAAVSILPITVSGVGVRDAIFIFFFKNIGLSSASAISFSLIFLLENFLIFVVCAGQYAMYFTLPQIYKSFHKFTNKS